MIHLNIPIKFGHNGFLNVTQGPKAVDKRIIIIAYVEKSALEIIETVNITTLFLNNHDIEMTCKISKLIKQINDRPPITIIYFTFAVGCM